MNGLVISRIEPFGTESAEVTLSNALGHQITAFCWPCGVSVGDMVPNRLHCGLDGELQAASLSDWPDHVREQRSAERLEQIGTWHYKGVGHVVDQAAGLVKVLGFIIEFDNVPCDGPVEFEVPRLDLR